MIVIDLESEGENRRGRLTTLKSPFRRRILVCVSIVLVALANYFVLAQDGEIVDKLPRLVLLSCAIPFVVWFLLSSKYTTTLGTIAEAHHVVTGKHKSFEYALATGAVIEKSRYGERMYPYSDYIRHDKLGHGYEHIVVFKNGLIYLPQYAVKRGNIEDFISNLEKHVTIT